MENKKENYFKNSKSRILIFKKIIKEVITPRIIEKFDLLDKDIYNKMRKDGKLWYISELIPFFKEKNIFMFANGGRVANLNNVSRLKDFNLFTVHNGIYYFYKQYGFVPNMWLIRYDGAANSILELDKKKDLDLSNTFIFVPSSDSISSVTNFNSPAIIKLRKRYPEATFVLFREVRSFDNSPSQYPKSLFSKGIEPIQGLGGANIEYFFLPFGGFLDVKSIFFSGVDHLPTGHFYDRGRQYQAVDGTLIDYPDEEKTLECSALAKNIWKNKGKKIYRLEEKETIFQLYEHLNFENAIELASKRINPQLLKDFYNYKNRDGKK